MEVGRVVESKAGRDKGRLLIITGIVDEQYVTTADGDLRVLERPKKKKLKHLRLRPQILSSIAEKLASGTKVFDAELRSALRALREEEDA